MNVMQQKYQIGSCFGSIMWDIEKLLIDSFKFNSKTFDVEQLLLNNPSPIDEAYAMKTDISRPPIVVQLSEGADKLIDGNHRLYKAYKSGVTEIECIYLTVSEHIAYICDYDEDTYKKVVQNW